MNKSSGVSTLKVPPFLGDPAATLLKKKKVLTNFSGATTSSEIQYTVGHLTVCAAATHEERNVYVSGWVLAP